MLILISVNIQDMVLDLMQEEVFLFPNGKFGQNVIMFGVDMSSSAHSNNKKNVLVLGEGIKQEIYDTILTAEKMYSINFTVSNKKFCLSLHYNGPNSYLFVNGTEIIKFKARDSETVANPLCLGNISEDFSTDNMKQTGLYGYVYDFSADYDAIAVDDILDIHKYLREKNNIYIISLGLLQYVFLQQWLFLVTMY